MENVKTIDIDSVETVENEQVQEGILPELSQDEELRAMRLANTLLGKSFLLGARIMKGSGKTIKYSGNATAVALEKTAGVVRKGANTSGDFLIEKSEVLKQKGTECLEDAQVLSELTTA